LNIQNIGKQTTDYFVRVVSLPQGWKAYAEDGGALVQFWGDGKYDIADIAPGGIGNASFAMAAVDNGNGETPAFEGFVKLELWHDVFGLNNTLLDTENVPVWAAEYPNDMQRHNFIASLPIISLTEASQPIIQWANNIEDGYTYTLQRKLKQDSQWSDLSDFPYLSATLYRTIDESAELGNIYDYRTVACNSEGCSTYSAPSRVNLITYLKAATDEPDEQPDTDNSSPINTTRAWFYDEGTTKKLVWNWNDELRPNFVYFNIYSDGERIVTATKLTSFTLTDASADPSYTVTWVDSNEVESEGLSVTNAANSSSVNEISGTLTESQKWTTEDGIYQITGDFTIPAGVRLEIDAGVVVKLGRYVDITVNGELLTKGTADFPVVFTSIYDDSYGGDTTGNGSQYQGDTNYNWGGIRFKTGSDGSDLNYAVVRYGARGNYSHMVEVINSSPTIRNSHFSNAFNDLVNIGADAAPTITRNFFMVTGSRTVFNSSEEAFSFTHNIFAGTKTDLAVENKASKALIATANYWADIQGPSTDDNTERGVKIKGNITVAPYLSAPLYLVLADVDLDDVINLYNNCDVVANVGQFDTNSDGEGDACDDDDDGDGVSDAEDYYPRDPERAYLDADLDGVLDENDNCPVNKNFEQTDSDQDLQGDVCDPDDDDDGIPDDYEIANGLDPLDSNVEIDSDDDGLSDAEEYTIGLNPLLKDSDEDGLNDGDEIAAGLDPLVKNDELIEYQRLTPSRDIIRMQPEQKVDISWSYAVSDDQFNLSGLILRVHFNSNLLEWLNQDQYLAKGFASSQFQEDADNFDNDLNTTHFIYFEWYDESIKWPGETIENLVTMQFKLKTGLTGFASTAVNISSTNAIKMKTSNSIINYVVASPKVKIGLGADFFSLDVTGDGEFDPFSDGLIINRFLMGYPAESIALEDELTNATRNREEIFQLLQSAKIAQSQ
jgi:hypothetical protein